MITLDFYYAIFDSATGAAQFLQLLRDGGDGVVAGWNACNHCDRFAAAMFAVAHYARDAVGLLLRYLIGGRCVALALFIRFPTGGAGIDSAVVGGIDKPVWH